MRPLKTNRPIHTALLCFLLLLSLTTLAVADIVSDTVRDYSTSFDELQRQAQEAQNAASPAPLCNDPACPHVTFDAQNVPTAVCALGRWLMSGGAGATLFNASLAYRLVLTGGENRVYRSGTFDVSGGDATTKLIVNTNKNVSLRLNGVQLNTLELSAGSSASVSLLGGASVRTVRSNGGTLNISGGLRLESIEGSGVTLTGNGTAHVSHLTAPISANSSGSFQLIYATCGENLFQGLQRVAATTGQFIQPMTVTHYGAPAALCYADAGTPTVAYSPLPTLVGKRYEAIVDNVKNECKIIIVDPPKEYLLENHDVEIINECVLRSLGAASAGVRVTQPASIELRGANTSGSLSINANTTLNVYGTCSFGELNVAGGARLLLRGSGSLSVGRITGADGVNVLDSQLNFSASPLPETIGGKAPARILILGDNSVPVANQSVILKIGGEGGGFSARTDARGYITLWRADKLSNVDVVALSGGDTFAAVLAGGSATADALPTIDKVVLTRKADVKVLLTATNAATLGVQYLIGDEAQQMPDVYMSGASLAYAVNGECVIHDVPYGKVVSLRVFAARTANIQLNEYTTDAFVFSEKRYDVRSPFVLERQIRTYSSRPFEFGKDASGKEILPDDATVEYYRRKKPEETQTAKNAQNDKSSTKNTQKQTTQKNEEEENKPLSGAPWKEGEYVAKVTIPEGNPHYLPGVYDVEIDIIKKLIYITPLGGKKLMGELDPESFYDYDPDALCGDDMIVGSLSRVKGEAYGNYPYRIGSIHAVDDTGAEVYHYEFQIAPDSPYFFINWNRHHYMPYDPFSRIDPVYDEVHLGSGGVLRVQRRTSEVMSLGSTYFGTLVTDTVDNHGRPATPSLRIRAGVDQALLIMTAEPELRKDGGYETDRDGNRVWRGRRLTLGNWHITHLKLNHIADISFSLGGMSLMFPLDALTGEEMDALLQQNGLGRANTSYCFELVPVLNADALTADESAAAGLLADGEMLMRLSAYVRNGDTRVDITPVLRGAQLLKDIDGLLAKGEAAAQAPADITETVAGKPVEARKPESSDANADIAAARDALDSGAATDDTLELALRVLGAELSRKGYALQRFSGGMAAALDSSVVVPYTSSEQKATPYTALMRTRPFLISGFRASGLYGLGTQASGS